MRDAFACLNALRADAAGYPSWYQHSWVTVRTMSLLQTAYMRDVAARVGAALRRGASIEEASELADLLVKEGTRGR